MMLRVIAASTTPPRGVLLAPGVALILVPGPARLDGAPCVSFRGEPLAAPYGCVSINQDPNPLQIAAVRLPQGNNADLPLLVEAVAGEHLPLYLPELDTEPFAIAAGLDDTARWRLLEFLLNFCCAAFRLGRSAPFARLCTRLALDCIRNAGIATVEAQIVSGRYLLSGMNVPAGSSLCVIGRATVGHSTMPVLDHAGLQVLGRVAVGDLIVACGNEPVMWTVDAPANVPHVLSLPETGRVPGAVARAACRQTIGRGPGTGATAQLLREMDVLYPAAPRKIDDPSQPIGGELELAIPDGAGGMFVAGWLRDPLAMIDSMGLATDTGHVTLTPDMMSRVYRPDVSRRFIKAAHRGADNKLGFLAYVPSLPGGYTLQPRFSLRLRSGSCLELTPVPRSLAPASARDTILGCVAPGHATPEMMQRCLAPAAERLHKAAMQNPTPAEVVQIGKRINKPLATILIPLYRNTGFLRFQLAALAEDAECRRSEVLFVLDSPEQRNEVEHLLRGLHRLTEFPVTLVIMPRNLGYAAANNAGAQHARAPILLLLNSDVVPVAPGWLRTLMEPFSRSQVGATGPKLLFEDGSIQHAGLYFERDEDGIWFNRHYHKGMPRHWLDAQRRRDVPGVTGAALAIRRSLYEHIGGLCEDYIIGDYEDSDLCLRIRAAGASITYVPEAELFHFERRSIALHTGYTRTHASLYNRLLHNARWDLAIANLMAEPGPVRRRRA